MAQEDTTLTVDLRRLPQDGVVIRRQLGDEFFRRLPQDEICGGDVEATLYAREVGRDAYSLRIELKGHVSCPCDRCLDEVELSVEAQDTLRLDGADIPREGYDAAWDAYEIIATNLPMRRVHPEGGCDADMLGRIITDELKIE